MNRLKQLINIHADKPKNLIVLIVLLLVASYAVASLAIDTGSLVYYALVLVALFYIFKFTYRLGSLIVKNGNKR